MRANLDLLLLTVLMTTGQVVSAQSTNNPAVASSAAAGAVVAAPVPGQSAGTPAAAVPPASVASAPALARPSDTIGETADRQRMARMLQSQPKPISSPAATATPGAGTAPVVGAINVERMPASAAQTQAAKPVAPQMALVEILRGPRATIVSIEVGGVERRVAEGDELGNGWRVKKVGRFTVDLEEVITTEAEGGAPNKNKSKAKPSLAAKKTPKAQTLALQVSQPTSQDPRASTLR